MSLQLIQLNEVNFQVVKYYMSDGEDLPGFKKLLELHTITTSSESATEKLEPWIQWPSIHTGLTFSEHGVFRLGDMVHSEHPQIFEAVEAAGFKVGAISPMNAVNRLCNPAYFIPDPWTETHSDGAILNRKLAAAIKQAVNDNSRSRLSFSSAFWLIVGFFRFVRPAKYPFMTRIALGAVKKPWLKALFLDLFLYEAYRALNKNTAPDFSSLFLNAGAHIQHHYFLNSRPVKNSKTDKSRQNPEWYINLDADPVLDMIKIYDCIVTDLLYSPGEILVATGLTQKPFNEVQFYYRLRDHKKFFIDLGVAFEKISPRMTRDFLVTFASVESAEQANAQLSRVVVDGNTPLFGEVEARGRSLFVTLTYPNQVDENTVFAIDGKEFPLAPEVSFVAIKNGGHSGEGMAFFSDGLHELIPGDNESITKLHTVMSKYFRLS